MKQAFDISSVILTLRAGVEAGRWTVEDLDRSPSGWFDSLYPPRNLLREAAPVAEKVQVIDDKDLPVLPTGHTPAEALDLPLTLEEEFPL